MAMVTVMVAVTVLTKCLREHPINKERQAAGKPVANAVLLLLRFCGSRLDAGLGLSFGIDALDAPGGTGDYHTELASKAESAAQSLTSGERDIVFVHVKAVDDAGHDRNTSYKIAFLEAVDQMIGQLTRQLWEAQRGGGGRFAIAVT
eukprot:gene9162-10860_t